MSWYKSLCDGLRFIFSGEDEVADCLLKPKPEEDTPVCAVTPITVPFLLNDPSKKVLVNIPLPAAPCYLPFSVNGYNGGPFEAGTPKGQAGNCYVTLATCLNDFGTMSSVNHWAATRNLQVVPRAGKMLNAYYDRTALKFFWEKFQNFTYYTSDSTDVVAHELGHALLDATRPDFWSVQATEIWAFHEAFADINAISLITLFDDAIKIALGETGGDLRKTNIISELAEQLGNIIFGTKQSLRNGVNSFKYVDPTTLPEDAPDNQLCNECHSFGRVFLGAWYELLVSIYEREKVIGKDPVQCLKDARKLARKWLLDASLKAPLTAKMHYAIARLMVSCAKADNSPYANLVQEVFQGRNLLPGVSMLADMNMKNLGIRMEPDHRIGEENVTILGNKKTIKIADKMPHLSMASVNGYSLSELEVDVASESMYIFNEDGRVLDYLGVSDEEVVQTATQCVELIRNKTDIGPDERTMWEVQDNKLVRTFVQ